MDKPIEFDGEWWLPETPEVRIQGKLYFLPGNILRLKLRDRLDKNIGEATTYLRDIEPSIINGFSIDGKDITLLNCFQLGTKLGNTPDGICFPTEFGVHTAFIGKIFLNLDEIVFSKIQVGFFNTKNWYNKSCIDTQNSEFSNINIEYVRPADIDIPIKDGIVKFAVNSVFFSGLNSTSISTDVTFTIIPQVLKPFQFYLDFIRIIQNFLSLLMNGPTFELFVRGSSIENTNGANVYNEIDIYYASASWQADAKETFFSRMLVSYNDIEANFSQYLNKWVENSEKIKPVYDLYFASSYRQIYPENEFLNLTQALETYHRRVFGGGFQDEEAYKEDLYKKFLDVIPDCIEESFYNSLKDGKLRYAFEYSLRQRIILICNHISEQIRLNFIVDKKGKQDFAVLVTHVRNSFVHSIENDEFIDYSKGVKLLDLIQKIKAIIKICFFEQMGMSSEEVTKFLQRDWFISTYLS